MRPTLTIFIDGLPYDQLANMPFSSQFASKARLVPSLGYSVNCQTELFTGKSPDEIGFWCEWSVSPETSPFRPWRHLLTAISPIDRVYLAKRVFHRLVDRIAPVSYTKNIPIPYLEMFDETGFSVFDSRFSLPSLLDDPKLRKFLHHQFPPGPDRDGQITRAVLDFIEENDEPGSILLTLVGIDHCSHWEGVGSEPYQRELAENDEHIRKMTSAFLAKQPGGVVLVVSDHGMTNIERTVEVEIEKNFGAPSLERYAYFSEATLLRIWIYDELLTEGIRTYLDGIEGIERLEDRERVDLGLTNPDFGTLIYHTPVGVQIVPSFWGPKPSLGMHGHHPRYPGQHGICLSSEPGLFSGSVRAREFYDALSSFGGK